MDAIGGTTGESAPPLEGEATQVALEMIHTLRELHGGRVAMASSAAQTAEQDEVRAARIPHGPLARRPDAVRHTFPTILAKVGGLEEDRLRDLARLTVRQATTVRRRGEAAGDRLGARHLLEDHQEHSIRSSIRAWVRASIPAADASQS